MIIYPDLLSTTNITRIKLPKCFIQPEEGSGFYRNTCGDEALYYFFGGKDNHTIHHVGGNPMYPFFKLIYLSVPFLESKGFEKVEFNELFLI